MTVQLFDKYKNIPDELKQMKRWICFKNEALDNGKRTKRPYNALSGKFAKVNDALTWTTFYIAINGCIKFNCDGLGFVLGEGIFGVDLDRHVEDTMPQSEFDSLANEFIEKLDSYTEFSQSGKGIHIICKGKLPEGARRKGNVEMYDTNRFFAFTGNVIRNIPINNREEQIIPLWEKYVKTVQVAPVVERKYTNLPTLQLSDDDIIQKAINCSTGNVFYDYYKNGNIAINNNDHSAADLAFCNMLAFWTNSDKMQMDRIFRNSGLMRDKWDEYRGSKTYGEITLDKAISQVTNGYIQFDTSKENFSIKNKSTQIVTKSNAQKSDEKHMSLDEKGAPMPCEKKVFGAFDYSDTGNAKRFYAYYGDIFRYNVTDKKFMFWTGKVWEKDEKKRCRMFVTERLIPEMKKEAKEHEAKIEEFKHNDEKEKALIESDVLKACLKNISRVSNEAGKNSLLNEFQSLINVPMESSEFNKDDFLLNTQSGVVDLTTGEMTDHDPKKYMSQLTNAAVSYEEPTEWLKFLKSVFARENFVETQEIIDFLQRCLGYSLSGSTKEQCMFILYGGGSNGKSTLIEAIADVLGNYNESIASSTLLAKDKASNSTFSIAKLQGARFVQTGETDAGGRFAEAQVKILTGGDTISAAFKYGNEFSYKPKFKIWMATNNKPVIISRDNSMYRRIYYYPFLNQFSGAQKDKNLPEKLRKERDKILGWCIKGFLKYQELNDLNPPECIQKENANERKRNDLVANFIDEECSLCHSATTSTKVLYANFKTWAKDNNEWDMPERIFKEDMVKKGFSIERDSTGKKYYKGLKLNGFSIQGVQR